MTAVLVQGEITTYACRSFYAVAIAASASAVLDKLKSIGIDTVELGTGNYPGDAHCQLSMLEDSSALADFRRILADHGATVSALSCHGNALHPDQARAKRDREVSRKTILLADGAIRAQTDGAIRAQTGLTLSKLENRG